MARTFLLLLLIAGLHSSSLGQDIFGNVTNEPRPSAYLHWDADAISGIKRGIEQQLADGNGIWDTGFIFERVLDDADYRPHSISIVHRSGYTQPEIHETEWDIYVILDGSGTARLGGERVNWIAGEPPEAQRPELVGYEEFHVEQGDLQHVPARVWHQLTSEPGTSITYALINIFE